MLGREVVAQGYGWVQPGGEGEEEEEEQQVLAYLLRR